MAEVGAGDGIWIKDNDGGGMGGMGGSTTMYLLRQFGVAGIGPVSFGGENQSGTYNYTGQSLNAQSFYFDGIKGAYNANIDQQSTNSITTDPPGGSIIIPYVLYGMTSYSPIPLINNISLHEFLDEKIGLGGVQSSISDRRSTNESFGGFISAPTAGQDKPTLLQNSGPSALGEIMNSVPHDPFIQQNQGSKTNNTGGMGIGNGTIDASSDNLIVGQYGLTGM